MLKYIFQRILLAILALAIISIFVYFLIATFAPDPLNLMAQQRLASSSGHNSNQTYEEILKNLQLQNGIRYGVEVNGKVVPGDKIPVIIRYFNYMGDVFKGNFGMPYDPQNNPDPSSYHTMPQLFFTPLKYTITITLPAMIVSLIGGITIGVFAGYKRGKLFDSISNIFVLIFVAVPSFIIAPLFIAIGVKIGILPVVPRWGDEPFGAILIAYIPPILVMTLGSLAAYVISTRNMVITVLTSNYVLIAKTKGLSSSQIFFKYVMRNISIPLFGLVFGSFLGLLSGSIIIEKYWNIPGTSQVIVKGFSTGEINIIMFSTLFFTLLGLSSTLLTDLAYVVLDPKITYASQSKKNYWLFFKSYLERQKMAKELFIKQNNVQNQSMKGAN